MRILSKGSELPFVHKSVGWDESTNFKDYDIVFVNLRSLEKKAIDGRDSSKKLSDMFQLFLPKDVREFINNDGDMIVYLPKEVKVKTYGGYSISGVDKNDTVYEYDLLDWSPFSLRPSTEESGNSVDIHDNDWEWYFRRPFEWNIILRPLNRRYNCSAIAKNSYGKIISGKIFKDDGSMALIPPNDSITYSEFVKQTLENVFDIESGVKGRAPPAWVSELILPNERNIKRKIKKKKGELEHLENQLDSLTDFKQLLYEMDTNLEEITRKALQELGFTIDDEIPGKRDGILHTTDIDFALEITGTTGGIKLRKSRQLDEWVENVIAGSSHERVSGLLIVNAEMDKPPEERDVSIEPNVRGYMERRGDYKVLTTVDLYRLVKCSIEEGVEKEDVEQIFYQDDTLLSLPDELYS